uniref:Uncharacterized protein n=1 Tax=Cucumis melo TaxID=3656 RepID=A0A9I9E9Q6_CUCME
MIDTYHVSSSKSEWEHTAISRKMALTLPIDEDHHVSVDISDSALIIEDDNSQVISTNVRNTLAIDNDLGVSIDII